MSNIVTEIVTMKCAEGVSKEAFVEIVGDLERRFHAKQDGFIDTELLYNEQEDGWIMIQHWASAEQSKAASKRMFQEPLTEAFRSAIDPRQVTLCVYPVQGRWGCAYSDCVNTLPV